MATTARAMGTGIPTTLPKVSQLHEKGIVTCIPTLFVYLYSAQVAPSLLCEL